MADVKKEETVKKEQNKDAKSGEPVQLDKEASQPRPKPKQPQSGRQRK